MWQELAIAVGLGLLVGLQREWAHTRRGGIRTFPLIVLFGVLCGRLAGLHGGWVVSAGLLALVATMVVINIREGHAGDEPPGPTTEIAALVMFAVGALLPEGHTAGAIATAGAAALLLQWKRPLHGFVERIGAADIRSVFRLALLAMVVLPALPDQAYGPYEVLNPFRIWLMVVLIVGISVGGYLASKLLGARIGYLLAGALGGVVSSTATSVSYARRSRHDPHAAGLAAMVIVIASAIVFVRVAFEIAVVAPDFLPHVLPQLAALTVITSAAAGVAYLTADKEGVQVPDTGDPSELGAAVAFGALYAAVLFALAAAREHFGDQGLYAVAALSGLTDMDAITLSTAEMVKAGRVAADTGWRMVVVGGLSNIAFKGAAIAALGSPALTRRVALLFGACLAAGGMLLWLWPTAPA